MGSTKIEWTDYSWNPIRTIHGGYHCTKVSAGCQNCYAEKINMRFGDGVKFHKLLNPVEFCINKKQIEKPLHWRKPRRIFVQSMGDLFHEDIPFSFIANVFYIIHMASQHTYMVLTKRPERMKEFIEGFAGPKRLQDWAYEYPNVWLGVTAENQKMADERIPILLQIPAAKRFVSVEPMLGPIDLSRWIIPRTPFTPENAPDTWSDFTWPDWVPKKVREQIEDFWGQFGRKPKDWAENAIHNDSPPFGMHMGYRDERNGEAVYGKWIFAWNNIGRLIGDNGEIYYPSIPRAHLMDATRYYWHDLHWVICGGETGSGARPMHPDWARGLRDQCQCAGTPFFFKSWGDWAPFKASYPGIIYKDRATGETSAVKTDGKIFKTVEWSGDGDIVYARTGKKTAGRLLDGKEWNEYPREARSANEAIY